MKFEDMINTIQLGNCYELIKDIPDKSIDLVYIDPPYDFMTKHQSNNYSGAGAFGKLGRTYHSELENSSIIKGIDTKQILDELCRVMKKVYIYIWCNKDQIYQYLDYFKDYNMELLTWHKTNPIPTCNDKYLSDTEYLLMFKEKGCKIYGTYETKSKYYLSTINKNDKDLFEHPTIKPLEFVKNHIINSSKENDIVLDCFCGSGTTCVACKETGRRYIGMEIDKEYWKIANNRINGIEASGQMAIMFDDKGNII